MDKDFKFNHEKYYDPTAYKALSNVQKGEMMNLNDNRTGEIWDVSTKNGMDYKALVIADNGQVVTCIKLVDEETNNCDFSIICQGKKYGSSRMIQHTFTQFCETFLRKLKDEEFRDIMDKVAGSLGIESKCELKGTVEEFIPLPEPDKFTEMELEKTKIQLEVYKGLYDDLIKKVMR